jgi:hypothetical protein
LLLENNRASGLVIMWLLGMVMDTKETLRIWVKYNCRAGRVERHNRLCRQQGRSRSTLHYRFHKDREYPLNFFMEIFHSGICRHSKLVTKISLWINL